MTQAIVNNLNKIEDLIEVQKNIKDKTSTTSNAIEKTMNSFGKVLDTRINNNNHDKQNSTNFNNTNKNDIKIIENPEIKDPKTLGDLKIKTNSADTTIATESLAIKFKEILAQATTEANTETSLDLTLTRDINEIISQLKEAVENTEENIESIENSEEILVEDVLEESTSEDINLYDEITNQLLPTESKSDLELENSLNLQENNETAVKDNDLNNSIVYSDKSLDLNKTDLLKNSINAKDIDTIDLPKQNSSDSILNFAETTELDPEVIKTNNEKSVYETEISIEEDILKDLNIESIESNTSNDSGSNNLMQNQAPEEYALKAMINNEVENFDIKLETSQSVQSNINSQTTQTKIIDINPSKILEQVAKQLEGLQSNSKINIVLNPESLGKVNIQLLSTKEGLTAQFTVTTQEAKDMLMKGLDGLKETLTNQGVGVDNVSVKLADTQKSSYNQDWTEQEGSRGGNKGQGQPNREEKEKGLFEKMMKQTNDNENGNV